MISDPLFYLAAIPGILAFGISKGGFGGGLGIVTVPLLLGVIAVGFVLYRLFWHPHRGAPEPASAAKGAFWGTLAGLTSFVAHSGGPPINVYLLPLRLAPVGILGVALGVRLRPRVNERMFYRIVYAFLLLTGTKLLYDAALGLFA